MLEHMELLSGKRLSDAGRRRLVILEAQLRRIAPLLEDGREQLRYLVFELDAVLDDEACGRIRT